MIESFQKYCLRLQRNALLSEWDPEKNRNVTPADISFGARNKIWWRCKNNHSWLAPVYSRTTNQAGCPYCTRKKPLPGESDFQTEYPGLAKQWHPTKNGTTTPDQVLSGSKKAVWWQCEKGHSWQASIVSRANGNGCPVCAGKMVLAGENDLATLFPSLIPEWNQEKNILTPSQVSAKSNRRVWWKCSLGHEWQAIISSRTDAGSGCPYCAGKRVWAGFNDLATKDPLIAKQWHAELNGLLTPADVMTSRHKAVWWKCGEGHTWKAVVYSRTREKRTGCPVCAGKLRKDRQYAYEEMEYS